MNRPIHFEIQSADPKETCAFFTKIFNWSFQAWGGPQEYHLATTGDKPGSTSSPGIDGGIMKAPDGQARTVNVIDVESVDEASERIAQAGGTIVVPKMPIPGVGWVAYALDPTGVLFGVYTADKTAK